MSGFDLRSEVAAREAGMVELRRHLHAHPELSFQEHETSALIHDRLGMADIPARRVMSTGVVGVIRGKQPGRTVMLRADIDALPIVEANDVPWKSTRPGVMHACGHDGHATILLTLAEIFGARRNELAGTVVFCFQPAEERFGGAKGMVDLGVMSDPKVEAVLGLHLWNDAPAGQLLVRKGPQMAAADEIKIALLGRKAHGAMPHQGVDAIVIAHETIGALQTLVSREVSPLQSAVITIGQINGGSAFNIIADRVDLVGTLRTLDEGIRQRLARRIGEVAQGVAAVHGGSAEYEFVAGCPVVVNDGDLVDIVREAGRDVVGADNIVEPDPTMGGDDVSFFHNQARGCYFFLGSGDRAQGRGSPHHTATFDIDDSCLVPAATLLGESALRFLRS